MTQYEGIRTASDIELNEAYRRLVAQGNSESAPLAKASRRWLASVCDEVNRRYPSEDDSFRFGAEQRDYGDEA